MMVAFYVASLVAVIATALAITRLNAVHALLYVIVSLLAVALVFLTLGAPLAAAVEVVVYAGAIMVLFLFVIMLLSLGAVGVERERELVSPRAWIGPSILAFIVGSELTVLVASGETWANSDVVEPAAVGRALFGPYGLIVAVAAFLLLAAMVGVAHVTLSGGKE